MINNRQAGRRRGRGGQQRSQGNPGRPDNGNRIDNRARGNAAQLLEKYKTLAADAQRSGDRVNTEYYLQFADHYFRVLAENRARQDENRRQNGQAFEDEEEYDEDGEPVVRAERPNGQYQQRESRDDQREQGQREQGQREQGQRDGYRDQGPREQRSEGGRGGNRFDRAPRDERDNRREEFGGEQREASADEPRRQRRPRRVEGEAGTPDEAFGADRLPPMLSVSAVSANENEADAPAAEEKPRRRRTRAVAVEPPAAS